MRTIETETERDMALSKMKELTVMTEEFLHKTYECHVDTSVWSRFANLGLVVDKEWPEVNHAIHVSGLPVAIRSSICDGWNSSGRFEYLSMNYDLKTNCVTIHGSRGWNQWDVFRIYELAKALFRGFAETVGMSMDID